MMVYDFQQLLLLTQTTINNSDHFISRLFLTVRVSNSLISLLKAHTREVCGLKWSGTGNFLVSGGNDNLVYIWDAFKMSSKQYLHRFNDHSAAVKALAWCPYNYDVLASGGGTFDGCIKMWSIRKGACISSTETRAQASFCINIFTVKLYR